MNAETYQVLQRLQTLGFSYDDAQRLRRISLTLRRWFEMECGTENAAGSSISIERDDNGDGKPFCRVQYMAADNVWCDYRNPIPDREAGARKRLAAIMAPLKRRLACYVQTDCRGPSLYILRKRDLKPGESLDSAYTSGVAVY